MTAVGIHAVLIAGVGAKVEGRYLEIQQTPLLQLRMLHITK